MEQFTFFGKSDTGRQRTNNEDAFVLEKIDNHALLAIAIDGVGGYEGGEVAAEIAQKEIPAYLREFTRGERLELLKQAVVCANNAILNRRKIDTERSNMSCVLTAAIIDTERKLVDIVHVGDTRMYQYHHGKLIKLTHDHSLIGYREEIGDLTEEEAMHHPQRNVISRDVGSELHEVEDFDFLEAQELPLLSNTIFLLCSDGLSDLITSKQIETILEQNVPLDTKVLNLIDAANEAGGKDNVTAILVEYQTDEVEDIQQVDVINQSPEEQEDTIQVKEDKTKRKHTQIIWILFLIITFLLGGCISMLLLQHSRMNNLKSYLEFMEYNDSISKQEIVNLKGIYNDTILKPDFNPVKSIALYARAIEENDFHTISQVFATDVRRYFNLNNISNAEVVKIHQQYDRKYGVKGKHVSIRWDTWETKQLPDGDMLVTYIEDYSIDRIDSTRQSYFVLQYNVVFNEEGKIVSCYYNEVR